MILIGPFKELISLEDLPLKGALGDQQLNVIHQAGIGITEDGYLLDVGSYEELQSRYHPDHIIRVSGDSIALPGFIDCHTHIAFAGSRAGDYALRNAGKTYLEIAQAGGGIWHTVSSTRAASEQQLIEGICQRAELLLAQGVTSIEVKSGYGLSADQELKMLRAIKKAAMDCKADLVATCLAAHMLPRDFSGEAQAYLDQLLNELLPVVLKENLSHRVDAFVEQSAFSAEQIRPYMQKAKDLGFDLTVHADQFTCSGSTLAVELGALSADHLEVSGAAEIAAIASSDTAAVVLPGASLGLGQNFAPARALLDAGACVAIASDWNPGSAPMGNLLLAASVLAARQKLTNAELFAGLTFRAAHALGLHDRGRLVKGMLADFQIYQASSYQEIPYHQGSLLPQSVWKKGVEVYKRN